MRDGEKERVPRSVFSKAERFLIFSLSGITYGLSLSKAKEVCLLGDLTQIPYCPHYVDGVMNLRGQIVVVVNLCKRLNILEKEQSRKRCLIVIKENDQGLGFLVDSVDQVLSFSEEQIQNTVHDHQNKQFLIGTVESEQDFTFLLNVDELVEKTNLYLNQEETKDVT